jgi:hypothetical protein
VIDVSAHGVDRRQRAEPRKYVRAADIPGMDDGIAAGKSRERLRPQQAMSIEIAPMVRIMARSGFGHLVVLPPAEGSSLSQRHIATRRNSCPRGSSSATRAPTQWPRKIFQILRRHCRSLLLRLDHAHRSRPWKIMSIARRDGQPGSGNAANASVGAGGRSKKFKTVTVPTAAAPKFSKTLLL